MKKNIAIVVLSILLALSIGSLVFTVFLQKRRMTKLTEEKRNQLTELKYKLEDRDEQIEDLKNNKVVITKEILKTMPDHKKDETILKLDDQNNQKDKIIKEDTKIINDLTDSLEETTKALEKVYIPQHGISFLVLGGVDQNLDVDVYVGVLYHKYLLNGRLSLGIGPAFKPYDGFGGGLILEMTITF